MTGHRPWREIRHKRVTLDTSLDGGPMVDVDPEPRLTQVAPGYRVPAGWSSAQKEKFLRACVQKD